jgi:NAD(P)-dependent dehydrogenase (short-subunit alcohol dehydrogenase family)
VIRSARDLSGKVVAVTGGARGIGKAIATALAEAGALVAIGDIDIPAGEEHSGAAFAAKLDVSSADSFKEFLDVVEGRLGPLDVLVNNAGIMPTGLIDEIDPRAAERAVQINLIGVMHGTREAIQRMKPRGHGHILNMSSLTANLAGAGVAAYAASKAGVLIFCQAAAIELHGTGIDISVVQPSLVKTELVNGIAVGKGAPACGPADVAERVVSILRRPQFQAFVPRAVAPLALLNQAVPSRVRTWFARVSGSDRLIEEMDLGARVGYDERLRRIVDRT